MKHSVILIFVLVCSSLRAQRIAADFYANYWAGGVCCSSGTDMSLTITVHGNEKNCFDEVQLITENGATFTLRDSDFEHLNSGDTLLYYRLGFGYSSHGAGYEEETAHFYFKGPQQLKDFRWNSGNENNPNALKLVLIRNRKTIPCEKLVIREDYTAYP